MVLKVLQLTYIVHEDTLPGLLFGLLSLVPQSCIIAIITAFIITRELELVVIGIGLVVSEIVNTTVKRFIQEPRPLRSYRPGHGMPSDHAQFMFFLWMYIHLLLQRRVNHGSRFVSPLLFLLAVCVGYSRVALDVHTVTQMIAGEAIGIIVGYVYYEFIDKTLRPWFRWIEELSLSQFLFIRDSFSCLDDIILFNYSNYSSVRRKVISRPTGKVFTWE